MNSIGLVCCYVAKIIWKYTNLYGRGGNKLTYLFQKCFDPLNISYSGCHGPLGGMQKLVEFSSVISEEMWGHTYIYILSFYIYIYI